MYTFLQFGEYEFHVSMTKVSCSGLVIQHNSEYHACVATPNYIPRMCSLESTNRLALCKCGNLGLNWNQN